MLEKNKNNIIEIKNINFKYTDKYIFQNFSLNIVEGACYAIAGESGKGKSTLFRLISGLEKIENGEIIINGKLVDNCKKTLSPKDRNVGLVFQDYALFPHLNVIKNIGYGCKDKQYIYELMDTLNIRELEHEKVFNLSGGQQQRVAIARTLATKPEILLLDEPFSNLDKANVSNIKNLIQELMHKYNFTTLIISHDEDDYKDFVDEVIQL